MRIAIVGSGISGLTTAWLLSRKHDVTLFEANESLGGHTNTVNIEVDGIQLNVDTGFIVFNEWTYPNFIGLMKELQVESNPTLMGFSVRCEKTGLEYSGSGFNGLFSQRRNLLRPQFYRLIRDIVRFNRLAPQHQEGREDETVGEFLKTHQFSEIFAEKYLLPMGAAIWSCPLQTFEQFPIRFIIEFYINHGLLLITGRPTWRTITGGAQRYIDKMLPDLGAVRPGTPVLAVKRFEDHVELSTDLSTETFDEVVLACHSDQALKMLQDGDEIENNLLSQFPYGKNKAVLHTDESVLPKKRRAWASWNYQICEDSNERPVVTYCMNLLQNLNTQRTICVTLNSDSTIAEDSILGRYDYSHPIFTINRKSAQQQHSSLIRHRRTSYCGAYWGNGFHEDGVNSALAVCKSFDVMPSWTVEEYA